MKTLIIKIFAAMLMAATLAGCSTVIQESATEWLQRQPWTNDSPT
jgi:uncharacterized protein YceK